MFATASIYIPDSPKGSYSLQRRVSMTRRYALVGLVLIAVVLGGCTTETSSSVGLQYEDTFMAEGPSDDLQAVDDATYTAGDRASLVLQDVTGFVMEDGQALYRLEFTITGPDGDVIREGSANGTATEEELPLVPHSFINIEDSMEPGQYEMSVSIHDRNSNGRVTATSTFQVEGTSGETDETGDNGDSDGMTNITWETYTNDAWNYSINHPASWNVSVESEESNSLTMGFVAPDGTNYIVESQRLVKQGLENWTQQMEASIEQSGVEATVSEGQVLAGSNRINLTTQGVQQRLVLTLDEYDSYEVLYNIRFEARESDFDTTWSQVFEPALQSFEIQE
jgi:hypothetical protein